MADNNRAIKTGLPVVMPTFEDWTPVPVVSTWIANTPIVAQMKRELGDMILKVKLGELTGAPTTTNLGMTVPLGLTIDQTRVPTTFGNRCYLPIESGMIFDFDQSDFYMPWVGAVTATSLQVGYINEQFSTSNLVHSVAPFTFAVNDKIEFCVRIPIAEWKNTAFTAKGVGLSTSKTPGIQRPRSDPLTLTVTGTGWTTEKAVGIFYMEGNDWYMDYHVIGSRISGAAITSYSVAVSGVEFETGASSACAVAGNIAGGPVSGYAQGNTSNLVAILNSYNMTSFNFKGSVKLKTKPTFI